MARRRPRSDTGTIEGMRLLSYNIHKGIGGRDRRYNMDRIIEVIEAENPDLICLQEVDRNVRRSSFHDQPADLSTAFRFEANLFQLNVRLRTGGYGNLVLSRWPFRDKHQLSIRHGRRKPRGAQMVIVETPEGPLQVVNWHLGLAERERQWQVRHLLGHDIFRRSLNHPTIIVGDFNDWRNRLNQAVFTHHEFEQLTTPPSRYRSFPAYMPVASLDKAFIRGAIQIKHVRVVKNRMTRIASDHLPLVVDFHINGQARSEGG